MASRAEAETVDRPAPSCAANAAATTRMAYVADLLLEREMVRGDGHETLAGLLTLAHAEALTKSR
ncbi:MAG: hypothetical protein MUE84_19500 [Hyphomonas sp.]|nr:hypothetical protein [Hyphomonas sp.]